MNLNPRTIPGGLLVIFEGIDGVGKTTQLELAHDALQAEGWFTYETRNLGGTPIGEALRDVMKSPLPRPPQTNLYLSLAIQEALISTLQAERAKGKIILLDRGPLSLAAYGIYGGGLDELLGWHYVEAGMEQMNPDLTILYRTDVKTALARLQKKPDKGDYFENQPLSYFEQVNRGYEIAAKRYEQQTAAVDAGQPIEVVHEATMALIRRALSASTPS